MKIDVCMLSSVHKALDIRIFYKESTTLAKAGYNVVLIAQHEREEIINGVRIVPFRKFKKRIIRILVSPLILFFIAIKYNASVYHFHDPELIITGVLLKITGKKVIYDVHEDISKQILYKEWVKYRVFRYLLAKLVKIVEVIGSSIFDAVVTATPTISGNFKNYRKITLMNLPILKLIDSVKPVSIEKEKYIILYEGGLTRIRGIKELIDSIKYVRNKVELWLFGVWESNDFYDICKSSEGWEYVKYYGFLKPELVYSYVKKADVGVVNFLPVPNHLNSIPNKPFEYMACALPIVMSDFPEWKDLFNECALFVNPENPKDIAEKIDILLDNDDLRSKLGKNGRRLTESHYSWEAESSKLLTLYRKILKD